MTSIEKYEVLLKNKGQKTAKELAVELGTQRQNVYLMVNYIKKLGGNVVLKSERSSHQTKIKELIEKYK